MIGIGGEEISEIYRKEESIPLQKILQRPMSAAISSNESVKKIEPSPAPFQSRKLAASGRLDPFRAALQPFDDEM